jgi:hypothetical protein
MRKPKTQTEKPTEVTVPTTRPKRAITTTATTVVTKAPTKKFNIEKRDNGTTIVDETKDTFSFSTELGSISAIVSPTSSSAATTTTTTTTSSLLATGIKKTKRGIMSSPSSAETIKFTSTVKQPSRTREILNHNETGSNIFSNVSAMNANTVVDSPLIINNKKVLKRMQTPIQATATSSPSHKRIFTPNTENNFVKMVKSHQKLIGEHQYKQLMNAQEVRNAHLETANRGEYKSDFDIIDEILSPKRPSSSPALIPQVPTVASTSKSATAMLAKPHLESKQSDKENKENVNDDDDDDIPPPPSKKSKSSIKITKLDKVEPATTATATRASKRTLATGKSIDYKEKSPEPLKPRQTRVKVVEKVESETDKAKKRKYSEKEVNDEQDGGGCSLKLYEDDEEEVEEKLIVGENKNFVENKQSPTKKETIKRVTRQRNTGVKLGKLISKQDE